MSRWQERWITLCWFAIGAAYGRGDWAWFVIWFVVLVAVNIYYARQARAS